MTTRSLPTARSPMALPRGANRRGLFARIGIWLARRQTRRSLALLDDHLLADIGLQPEAAAREIAKPFWRD